MKKLVLLLIPFLTGSFSAPPSGVSITGYIENYDGNTVLYSGPGGRDTLKVSADGRFALHTTAEEEDWFSMLGITRSPASFLVAGGDNMEIVFTPTDRGCGMEFKGDRAEKNNFAARFNDFNSWGSVPFQQMKEMSFREYAALVDKDVKTLLELAEEVPDREWASEYIATIPVVGDNFKALYLVPTRGIVGQGREPDPDFVAFMDGIDLNDRRVLNENNYRRNTYSVVTSRLTWESERIPGNSDSYPVTVLKSLDRLVTDNDIRNHIAKEEFDYYLTNVGTDDHLEEIYTLFTKICTDPGSLEKVGNKYQTLTALGQGKPAPDFEIIDPDGNRKMLSDIYGKYIYIDVWATWCIPCLAEVPALEKLYEKYQDNPSLQFVSISVDDDFEAWKEKVAKDGHGWQHYIVDGGFRNGPMYTKYDISGIPRFIFLDKEGKIISVNAPRPSSPQLENLFKAHIEL